MYCNQVSKYWSVLLLHIHIHIHIHDLILDVGNIIVVQQTIENPSHIKKKEDIEEVSQQKTNKGKYMKLPATTHHNLKYYLYSRLRFNQTCSLLIHFKQKQPKEEIMLYMRLVVCGSLSIGAGPSNGLLRVYSPALWFAAVSY